MTQQEYREFNIMFFYETWMQDYFPNSNCTISSIQTVRADKDGRQSSKKRGEGTAVLVSNRWSNPGHITVKERSCSPDIELLAISLCSYYLPREFTCVIVITTYIPLSDASEVVCDVIHSVTSILQTQHPNTGISPSYLHCHPHKPHYNMILPSNHHCPPIPLSFPPSTRICL